ncbi:DUF4974 domain-containing protein [Chitinophaga horti]|uniref:DUF4974 domain-containing protein n=1 Tax=Chitinophaga horti TaxID=2920382 RepID=A0ABY6IZM7_9BACT|nr:FecR domain-containing protein [Chitinophaga horti]UYQ91352.1 DUF4974 domain-containing protein [Chitinophaga horti]
MNLYKRKRHSWQPFTAGIILVMLLASGFVYYDRDRVQRPSNAVSAEELRANYKAHHCQPGSRKQLTLEDGTRVTLNSQTTLYVPKDYNNGKRSLVLNGEAFFEIPASRNLFTVKSDKLITTGFSGALRIRSADAQAGATIHVLDGQFTVTKAYHSPTDNQPEMLQRGNEILFNRDIDLMEKETYDVASLEEWKSGKLVFDNVPVQAAINKLQDWYGVEIAWRGDAQRVQGVSGTFDNMPLQEVLATLKDRTGLKYNIR